MRSAQLGGRERSVRARVAGDELLKCALDLGDERLRQSAGRHAAERVAVEAGVVGRDPALLAAQCGRRSRGADGAARRAGRRRRSPRARARAPRPSSGRRPGAARHRARPTSRRGCGQRCAGGPLRRQRARPRRSVRAAPPGRAARAAGRGRATAPPHGVRRSACRPRTCRSRRSRTAARRRTARRSGSRPRPATARGGAVPSAAPAAPARRARRAGTRGRSRG